jgi:hypothetical protein
MRIRAPKYRDPELRARAAIEAANPGWRTGRAREPWMVRPDIPVPEGHFWATHLLQEVPAVVAASTDELAEAVAEANRARVRAVVDEVTTRFPDWRVGYLGPGRRPRNIPGQRGQFYAVRKRRFGWLHQQVFWPFPVIGWTAADLCKEIEIELRERPD